MGVTSSHIAAEPSAAARGVSTPSAGGLGRSPGTAAAAWATALVATATVITLECARVLFSLGYHTGEDIGWVTAGAVVVVLFAAAVLAAPLQRLAGSRHALTLAAAVLVALRLAVQLVDPVPFWVGAAATGAGLLTVTIGLAALRSTWEDGSVLAALAVSAGVVLDLAVRATGATWDVPWRDDVVAVSVTLLLLGLLAAAALACRRAGITPDDEDPGGPLVSFLVWPYLYLVVVYLQSPAHLDASVGVSVAAGVAIASLAAAVGFGAILLGSRVAVPRAALAAGGIALAGCGFVLPVVSGLAAVVVVLLAQFLAAGLVGAAAGAGRGVRRPGISRTASAAAGGGVVFAASALLYALHTIQPLPITNRVVPSLVGLCLALAATARPVPDPVPVVAVTTTRAAQLAAVAAALAVLSVGGLVLTAPEVPDAAAPRGSDGSRAVSVMTFNVGQGVTDGQLDLEQLADVIETEDADVVVLEEVARGWSLSGMTDEAEWFGRRLGLPYVWSPAADAGFGNVVLSRLPITGSEVVELDRMAGTQDRSAAFVWLDTDGDGDHHDGNDLLVIGTHLQNGSEAPIHAERAASYEEILGRWDGQPATVLLGDLNTYPREVPPGWPELDLLLDAGFRTTQDIDRCTVPTSNENCPDWIFTSPDLSPATVHVVVDRPDHRPIAATVEVPGDR